MAFDHLLPCGLSRTQSLARTQSFSCSHYTPPPKSGFREVRDNLPLRVTCPRLLGKGRSPLEILGARTTVSPLATVSCISSVSLFNIHDVSCCLLIQLLETVWAVCWAPDERHGSLHGLSAVVGHVRRWHIILFYLIVINNSPSGSDRVCPTILNSVDHVSHLLYNLPGSYPRAVQFLASSLPCLVVIPPHIISNSILSFFGPSIIANLLTSMRGTEVLPADWKAVSSLCRTFAP